MPDGRIRLIQIIMLLGQASHCSDLLPVDLMLLVGVLVQGSGGIITYIGYVNHFLVVTLLDVRYWWHYSSD